MERLRVSVLGACEIEHAGGAAREPSPIQRRLLARLAAASGRPLTWGVLAEAAWPEAPPRTAKAAILNQVSRLRRDVHPDLVVTTSEGYHLGVPTDFDAVADAVADGERLLHAGHHAAAAVQLDDALSLWRGRPFADIDHVAEAEPARKRAAELRHSAENLRLLAALREGRTGFAVPEAERLVAHAPYDEQRWVLLAQALDLAGRRGDALAVFDRARRSLRQGLGLDDGPVLRSAEAALLGVDPAGRGTSGTDVRPIVGRERELAVLEDLVDVGAGVLVRGEAGVGVSAILAEVARRSRPERVVARTVCSTAPATPLAALTDLLDQLGHTERHVRGVAEQVGGVVRELAADRPVLLVVDDLERAGPSTISVLRELAKVERVSVVAAAHGPVPGPDEEWHEVEVGPLERDAVVEMAQALAGRQLEPDEADWIVVMSGGNALFVQSLVEHPTGLGTTLVEHVRARLELLDPSTRTAIEVAAVAGAEFPASILAELVPPSATQATLDAGLLVDHPGHRLVFRHRAVQRVVENDLPPGRRTEIHHVIANLLHRRTDTTAVTLARHRFAARELDPAAAVDAARHAARESAAAGAHRDAAEWFRRGADAAGLLGPAGERDRIRCTIGEGDELRLAGDPRQEEVLSAAAAAALASGDPSLAAEAAFAALQLGFTTASGRSHQLGSELADRALASTVVGDDRARVQAAASLGYSMTGEVERCRELFVSAMHDATSAEVRRQVLPFAYMALGTPDDLELRAAVADELLELGTEAHDPVASFEARHLAFSVALQRADGVGARAHLDEMVKMVDQVGDVGRRWALLYQMAAVAHLDDRLDRSERLSEDALALFAPVSATRALAAHGGQLIAIRLAQGRIAELADTFELMVAEQPEVPAWHAPLALALVDGDRERAAEHARRALTDVPRDFLWLAAHVIGGRAAAVTGDTDTVELALERLQPWTDRACWQGTCSYGPIDTVLALLHRRLGDDARAAEHAGRALAVAERLGAPVFVRELRELDLVAAV